MGKPQRGKIGVTSRKKMHRRSSFAPHASPLGAVCLNSRTTWARSTEQRYKKKSNYKRRTPDCVFLCRESAATAPPYNEMGSSSQFVCKVTKSRNNHKNQSQKLFISSKFIRTIRQHFTPTRAKKLVYYLAKTETFSTKLHCFIHRRPIRPHFLFIPTLFCPSTRTYAHSANFRFFAFTLHHPQYLPHSW